MIDIRVHTRTSDELEGTSYTQGIQSVAVGDLEDSRSDIGNGKITFIQPTNKIESLINSLNVLVLDIFANAGGSAIGSAVGSSTAESVLFVGPGELLAQDPDFRYNSTNKSLYVKNILNF